MSKKDMAEVADSIEETPDTKEMAEADVDASLSTLDQNKELAALYQESAEYGAANLSQGLPTLKIHYANQSKNNELLNGKEPNNGWFYYTATQQQFEEVTCHILSISKGYRAEGFEGKEDKYHQLLAGMIVDEGKFLPFMFFVKGMSLQPMWDFGKSASKWTKAKPHPLPMYALTVRMFNEQEPTKVGNKVWVTKYEIVTNDKGQPKIVTDIGMATFLKDSVAEFEGIMASIIENKSTEQGTDEPLPWEGEEPR